MQINEIENPEISPCIYSHLIPNNKKRCQKYTLEKRHPLQQSVGKTEHPQIENTISHPVQKSTQSGSKTFT
jgi:hypothetical protein